MKTYKHLYDYFISDENIRQSAHNATMGKLKHAFLQDIKEHTEDYIPSIRSWGSAFYNSYHKPIEIYDGITRKKRTIVVPSDKEQVVHHMIVNTLKPVFLRGMYEHAYGSVPGRGTEKCAEYIRRAIEHHPKDCKYCLKTDIHHYFDSIDRTILKRKLAEKITDRQFLDVVYAVIEYDKLGEILHEAKKHGVKELFSASTNHPTKGWFPLQQMIAEGRRTEAAKFISHLDTAWEVKAKMIDILISKRTGIPLGFYTSQWLSQFYLQDFDHYIKETLGAEYYWRYVDDQVLFGRSKRQLHKIREAMKTYLNNELHLELKDNWQVFRFDYIAKDGKHHGRDLDFLGYRFFCDRTILRKTIMLKCSRKAARIYKKQDFTAYDARQMLSYLGRIDHSDTYGMYLERVKPLVSIKKCKRKVSAYDKARKRGTCTQREATTSRKPQTPPPQRSTATTAPA